MTLKRGNRRAGAGRGPRWSRSTHNEAGAAPPPLAFDLQPGVDQFLELGDVRDDADHAPALLEVLEGADREVERFGVEGAEALVDEDRLEADAAGVALHDVGEAERQGEAGEEAFA